MDIKTYQAAALKTAKPTALHLDYLLPGLIAEIGECYGKVAKARRDQWLDFDLDEHLAKEWGDVAWFVAVIRHTIRVPIDPWEGHAEFADREDALDGALSLSRELWGYLSDGRVRSAMDHVNDLWRVLRDGCQEVTGRSFDAVLEANLAKLADRANRGKIGGSGDAR